MWEQLIRSVRKVLNSVLKTQNLDEECLHKVFCEVEAIIYSRPIMKASTDPNDLEALTPNHLLLLKSKPSLPPGVFQREDIYVRRPRKLLGKKQSPGTGLKRISRTMNNGGLLWKHSGNGVFNIQTKNKRRYVSKEMGKMVIV